MANKIITVSLLLDTDKLMGIHKTDTIEEAICLHFDLLQDDGIFLKDLQVINNLEVARSEEVENELMHLQPRDDNSALKYFKEGLQTEDQIASHESLILTNEEKEAIDRYDEEYKKYERSGTRIVKAKNYSNNFEYMSTKLEPVLCIVETTSTCFNCRYYDTMNMRMVEPSKCMDCCAIPPAIEDLKLDKCTCCTNFDEIEGIYKDSNFCEGCVYSDVTMLEVSDKVKEQAEKQAREEELTKEHSCEIVTYHSDGTCTSENSKVKVNSSVILHNKDYSHSSVDFNKIYGFNTKPTKYSASKAITRITRIKR